MPPFFEDFRGNDKKPVVKVGVLLYNYQDELSVFIRAEHDKRLLERGIKVKPHSRIP